MSRTPVRPTLNERAKKLARLWSTKHLFGHSHVFTMIDPTGGVRSIGVPTIALYELVDQVFKDAYKIGLAEGRKGKEFKE